MLLTVLEQFIFTELKLKTPLPYAHQLRLLTAATGGSGYRECKWQELQYQT